VASPRRASARPARPWPLLASLLLHGVLFFSLAVPVVARPPSRLATVTATLEASLPPLEAPCAVETEERPPIEFDDVEVAPDAVVDPVEEEPQPPVEDRSDRPTAGDPLPPLVAVTVRRRPRGGARGEAEGGPPPVAVAAPVAHADAGAAPAAAAARTGVHRRAVPWASNRGPEYPIAARAAGVAGDVLLHLHVDAAGFVRSVEVVVSSGFAELDAAAERAALLWRFEPAQRDGGPVATVVRQRVRFQLDG
jgi:protein TonB